VITRLKGVRQFAGESQGLLPQCAGLIRIPGMPQEMGRPATGKQPHVHAKTREVRAVLARVVEDLGVAEVPKCGGSGLAQMERGPGEFHVPEYRVGRIPKLLRQSEDLPAK